MPDDHFHIAFCFDHAFISHTAVAIRSLVDNASDAKRLHLWLLDIGISAESRQMVMDMTNKLGVRVDFQPVSLADDATLLADRHVSRATYGRLLLPDILDASIGRCLYLDGDLIVLDDILKLYEIELQGKSVAAVDDYYLTRNDAPFLPTTVRYFNAGVVLMDLDRWRREGISRKILNFARKHPEGLLYWDQDAMNAVLYRHIMTLPLRWNHQVHFDDCLSQLPGGGKASEMKEAMTNPAIVHFVGPEKPWHYLCLHPYKDLYFKYRERTPWRELRLPDPEQMPSFFNGRRIVVFGAGKTGKVTIRQYRQYGCNPEYVIDNDQLKVGCTIQGLPIRSPSYLLKERQKPDSMVIVIASMFRDEIKAQLENIGLQEFRHFVARGDEPLLKTV